MPKISLTNLASESSTVAAINNNNDTIETAFENTLSRDGTVPNEMESDLDLNNFRILNLPIPVGDSEPVRLGDVAEFFTSTSTTSVLIGTGSKQFTTAFPKASWGVGTRLRATSSANPTTHWVEGVVTSYTDERVLTLSVDLTKGSGSRSDWIFNIIGETGGTGPTGFDRANHTGTQLASTISDFDTEVSNNTDVDANTTARHTHANKTVLDNTTASFTTADETKLDGIESGAQPDQTGAEIKTLYEAEADTNAFTDTEKTKLAGIETGAEVNDVTSVIGQTGAIAAASQAEAEGGISSTVLMTPERTAQAIDAQAPTGIWEHIETQTPSGATSVDIINLGVFRMVRITAHVIPGTDAQVLRLRTDNTNGDSFDSGATDYTTHFFYGQEATASAVAPTTNDRIDLTPSASGNASGEALSVEIVLTNFNQTVHTYARVDFSMINAAGAYLTGRITGRRNSLTAQNAAQLQFASGTISGFVVVEGIRG